MNRIKVDLSVFNSFLMGDERAFSQIFYHYSEDVLKRIQYIVKDEEVSMEIMQQLFVKLWNNKSKLSITYESLDAYLNKMVSSLSIDYLRKSIRTRNLINTLSYNADSSEESSEDEYIYKESLHIIEDAINSLPPQRKQIFTLCRLEGKSYNEVSELLGISISTVSNQLVSANKSIRMYASKFHLELKIILVLLFF